MRSGPPNSRQSGLAGAVAMRRIPDAEPPYGLQAEGSMVAEAADKALCVYLPYGMRSH